MTSWFNYQHCVARFVVVIVCYCLGSNTHHGGLCNTMFTIQNISFVLNFFADRVSICSTQRKRRGFCTLTHKHGTHTPYMECLQGTLFQTILFSHVGEIWTSELPWCNALILICVIFWICILSMVNCLFNFGRYFRCANIVHKYIYLFII